METPSKSPKHRGPQYLGVRQVFLRQRQRQKAKEVVALSLWVGGTQAQAPRKRWVRPPPGPEGTPWCKKLESWADHPQALLHRWGCPGNPRAHMRGWTARIGAWAAPGPRQRGARTRPAWPALLSGQGRGASWRRTKPGKHPGQRPEGVPACTARAPRAHRLRKRSPARVGQRGREGQGLACHPCQAAGSAGPRGVRHPREKRAPAPTRAIPACLSRCQGLGIAHSWATAAWRPRSHPSGLPRLASPRHQRTLSL